MIVMLFLEPNPNPHSLSSQSEPQSLSRPHSHPDRRLSRLCLCRLLQLQNATQT
ncbi:hypothetical protein HYC85_025066 [Camellia sinensis]|uniref:Uncharacterized protein n=1 Tax=Camellia sinensis TaxID=4442 RepID=A0A7J7G9W9_CAMSI|nr:hypothetical protein HYC85_025066 [Camellia sinensis]